MTFFQRGFRRFKISLLAMALFGAAVSALAQPETGWSFDRHAVVLGADTDRVYIGLASPGLSLAEALHQKWEVHSAPRTGGALVKERLQPKRVDAWAQLEGIQHVAMHPTGDMALISASRNGGDLDLYLSHRTKSRVPGGRESWSEPLPLDGLNSVGEEVFPHWEGRDIAFASNKSGRFELYKSDAVTQWLRAKRMKDLEGQGEMLSFATMGPGLTWISMRKSDDDFFSVQRSDWPQPSVQDELSLCLNMGGVALDGQVLVVRDASTRETVRVLRTGEGGCASLAGLPLDRVWQVQWLPEASDPYNPEVSGTTTAELKAADGKVMRRYVLSASRNWEWSLLPLDPLAELTSIGATDRSNWPRLNGFILLFNRAQTQPLVASWSMFQDWAASIDRSAQGHWEVVGHADSSGNLEANEVLSLQRATHVASHLTEVLHWPIGQIQVRGEGSRQPLGQDPAQNRRVEVHWVPSMK